MCVIALWEVLKVCKWSLQGMVNSSSLLWNNCWWWWRLVFETERAAKLFLCRVAFVLESVHKNNGCARIGRRMTSSKLPAADCCFIWSSDATMTCIAPGAFLSCAMLAISKLLRSFYVFTLQTHLCHLLARHVLACTAGHLRWIRICR